MSKSYSKNKSKSKIYQNILKAIQEAKKFQIPENGNKKTSNKINPNTTNGFTSNYCRCSTNRPKINYPINYNYFSATEFIDEKFIEKMELPKDEFFEEPNYNTELKETEVDESKCLYVDKLREKMLNYII